MSVDKEAIRELISALGTVPSLAMANARTLNIGLTTMAKNAVPEASSAKRDARLQLVSEILGRRVTTTKDLNDPELAAIQEILDHPSDYASAYSMMADWYKEIHYQMVPSMYAFAGFVVPATPDIRGELKGRLQEAGFTVMDDKDISALVVTADLAEQTDKARREAQKEINRIKREIIQAHRLPGEPTDPTCSACQGTGDAGPDRARKQLPGGER